MHSGVVRTLPEGCHFWELSSEYGLEFANRPISDVRIYFKEFDRFGRGEGIKSDLREDSKTSWGG
jgi:hypothetical protein